MRMLVDKEVLSVSELNNLVRDVVNMGFPNAVWVCGEIQGFDRNKDKKHIFFDLCEKDEISHDVVARIGLVIFSGKKVFIDELLDKKRKNYPVFALKDDIEVKFLCRVDFYPPHGAMRLIVESIDPIYTLGKIAQEKQKLIALLKQRGTLDKNKAIPLPEICLRIGLITAYDSAAYNDFVSELKLSRFGFKVYHRNALMQGKNAPTDVGKAMDQLSRLESLEVIVITRGGGSISDLSCFDSEMIAEKIGQCRLPVLSGIGHEINITITDLAAHTYQKTPTAIARFLVAAVENFITQLEDRGSQAIDTAQNKISGQRKLLQNRAIDLHDHARFFFKKHHEDLLRCREVIKRQPLRLLKNNFQAVSKYKEVLLKAAKLQIQMLKLKGMMLMKF